MYKLLLFILLFITFFRPVSTIIEHRSSFFNSDYWSTFEELEFAYYNSQYVKKDKPIIIPDEIFEAFAGGIFLKGLNPILITHDHPPMGRYIISLSIILFNNAKLIVLPLMLLSLLGLFLIGKEIFKNNLLPLIPIAIFTNEPLFFQKLIYVPIPEATLFPFIIWCLYFYIKFALKSSIRYAIIGAIFLGFVISIRVFTIGLAISAAIFLFHILMKRFNKDLVIFLLTLPFAVLVLMLSYTRTIVEAGNPLVVLGIQKYILAYHSSKFILPFSFWDLLMFNRWHTWWGSMAVTSDSVWMYSWPIAVIIVVLTVMVRIKMRDKFNSGELILLLFLIVYCSMLSLSYTSTRYFMPIIPLLYILTVYGILRISKFKKI